jgi:hypothetical protein
MAERRPLALVVQPGRLPDEEARGLDLRGHVRDEEVDALVHRDRLAELDALLRVPDRVVARGLRDAYRARRRAGAGEVERLHRNLEALALRAETVLHRHPHVLEGDRGGVRRALPHLVEVPLDDDAVEVGRDGEGRQAAVPLRPVGRGEDDEPRRMARVRDEHLRAVQDVLVAAADGRRLDPRDVRPGVRLREGEGTEDRLLDERDEKAALLLVRAGDEDGRSAERVGRERRRHPGAAPGELLADQHAVEARELEATVLGRDVRVQQAELVRLGDHVGGVRRVLVVLGGPRPDLLLRELVRELAERLLLVGQGKRDPARSCYRHAALPLID